MVVVGGVVVVVAAGVVVVVVVGVVVVVVVGVVVVVVVVVGVVVVVVVVVAAVVVGVVVVVVVVVAAVVVGVVVVVVVVVVGGVVGVVVVVAVDASVVVVGGWGSCDASVEVVTGSSAGASGTAGSMGGAKVDGAVVTLTGSRVAARSPVKCGPPPPTAASLAHDVARRTSAAHTPMKAARRWRR